MLPRHSGRQWHTKPSPRSTQVPPFWQVLGSQWEVVEEQVRPFHSSWHTHVKSLSPSLQEALLRHGRSAHSSTSVDDTRHGQRRFDG